jgi:hypothetical protein
VSRRVTIRVQKREGIPRWWWVRVGGLEMRFTSQYLAGCYARELALRHEIPGGKSEVIYHRRDGTIGRRDTYPRSSDPRRTRG